MKKLNKQDMIDILYGCAVLGTGGGGSLQDGLAMMEEDFAAGKELLLADLSEIPDDAYVATPYGCGAPLPERPDTGVVLEKTPAIMAFESLERYIGETFFAVSSTELGGLNTAEALHTACQLERPLTDSDPAGRSVPELIHSTYYLYGKPIYPFSVATNYGDVAVFEQVRDDFRAEELARAMAVASGNEVSVCDHPMTGRDFRESVIGGAITYALEIGQILRRAKEESRDAASAIAEAKDGAVLFRGVVSAMPWESRDGFNFGSISLAGTGEYEGQSYRIDFQNENIAAYRDGRLEVTVPDLICMIDGSGDPMTTPDFSVGDEMNVIALPAPKVWTTEKGLEIFGPRHFGIDCDYRPFDKR